MLERTRGAGSLAVVFLMAVSAALGGPGPAASPIPAAKSLEDVVVPTTESIKRELERLAVEKGALTARS